MIPRYTRPEMAKIWSEENKYRIFCEVEVLACEAQAELGNIPAESARLIRQRASVDPKRIEAIESEVHHDVIAFLTALGESVGPDSRYIHDGMTSSDLIDTTLAVQMKQSADLLLGEMSKLQEAIGRRAREFKKTLMVGRTHGVHAEPITFGLKLAVWYDEVRRHIRRLENSRDTVSVGLVSGVVGTFACVDPFVEKFVCGKLGLQPAPASTQVLQRDRHAEFLTCLALAGASLEKFAVEIRHLQKTEVLEVEESFSTKQKGSSAMPHKRNPITCERVAGLARVLRANAHAALENIALWHERDISHSSVERIIIPDSCILLHYMLGTMTRIVDTLVVHPETMRKNLDLTRGLIYSQSVLLALTRKGMKREDAYAAVQKISSEIWSNPGKNFQDALKSDPTVNRYVKDGELKEIFDPEKFLGNVDLIFKRVGLA